MSGAQVLMLLGDDITYDSRVRREARALADAGHRVTIVTRAARTLAPGEREGRLGDVRLLRVDFLTPAWHRLRLPAVRRLYTAAMILLRGFPQPELAALAARQPADVVHAHNRETLLLGRRLARAKGAGLVFDDHEFFLDWNPTGLRPGPLARARVAAIRAAYGAAVGPAVRAADAVITVNESLAQAMARHYRIPTPAVVMNCPDTTHPEPNTLLRERAGLPPDALALLYQGALYTGRALPQTIQSLAHLPERYHLVILGYGPMEPALRQLAGETGLGQRVHFLPPVPPESLLSWTSGADLGLSVFEIGRRETFYVTPNKLFEYLMAGLPVVASDAPEIRRIMARAQAGVLLESAEPQAIAAAARAVLEGPEREAYRRRGRAAALERYNWQVESRTLVELYERVLR